MITQERLQSLLTYNQQTGCFTRKIGRSNQAAGDVAGSKNESLGYAIISIDYNSYYAHRLAFLYMKGRWPHEIDHKNGIRDDNRWSNLREVTRSKNNHNSKLRTDNSSGYKGVSFHKQTKKWRAYITVNFKRKHLGLFATAKEAHLAYVRAAEKYFGEFARAK